VTGARPLRAFLIDDEPLSVKRLARMLEATGRVEIVGRATDPQKGLKQVAAEPVDVVFLDIHMPGLSGFEVVERLPAGPLVVFTTAYDQHAVQAFELNAVDYLLKPIERARLDRTLDRVAHRRDEPAGGEWRGALERLARNLRPSPYVDHVASRVGDRVQLVGVDEVTHVFARDRGTYAAAGAKEHMLDVTIADLERKLDPARFLRIHRGILVNLRWVGELHADFGGRLLLRLKDERRTELVVSRDRVRELKERLGL
jgi:two-component system, LytTR family, response regulator